MTDRDDDDMLEDVFMQARAAPPVMPDALVRRVLADAATVQPRAPWWQQMLRAVGGPAGVGGLVTATVAGFWIGLAPPAQALDPLALVGTDTAAEAELPGLVAFGWDLDEEDGA
ncbi:hypothetical protein [Sulfitobacter sp. S190]|uniref:hypothetical protein n=1 Tax=Sulfitobacter sp. S190 TaxID=2867022 RepID=UPI0021A90EF1|nr:hypothetical protein [Sulfitobacter sp. S190]UWR23500.1 hypothetical protein K3756_05840 [Sulfitobacter sp. S190]